MNVSMSQPFADLALARRLERTEGRGNAAFVDALARIDPASGAIWKEIGGTFAMFAGIGSPITQTFGLGVHQPLVDKDLDAIERFFTSRASPIFHEVSPLAGVEVSGRLAARQYTPVEMSNVLYYSIGSTTHAAANDALRVRVASQQDAGLYATTAARGWSERPEVMPYIEGFAKLSIACATCFFAERDGEPIATAALYLHDGTALLAGASTVPSGRRQGAQNALLDARLRHAAANGCDLAMMVAAPGSDSQRNAERQGFRIAYTRTKWRLDA
jgi:hypothetical protein